MQPVWYEFVPIWRHFDQAEIQKTRPNRVMQQIAPDHYRRAVNGHEGKRLPVRQDERAIGWRMLPPFLVGFEDPVLVRLSSMGSNP